MYTPTERLSSLALVKSLVQRLNEAGWGLPLEGKKGLHIKAERVFQRLVGEIKLSLQVEALSDAPHFDLSALLTLEWEAAEGEETTAPDATFGPNF